MNTNDSSYAREYVRKALKEQEIDQPDPTRLNGYSEALEALYRAHHKGGTAAAQNAWKTIIAQHPALAVLNNTPSSRIIHVSELKNLLPAEWLINGMLPKRALCELHGASGSGKSFFALHLAATLAVEGAVLYVAAEGASGYNGRVEAWQEANDHKDIKLYFMLSEVNLFDREEVLSFIEEAQSLTPILIVFDTLARCMIGGDENSAKDMGIVVQSCDLIRHKLETTVLVVHHTGKSGGDERGSSALRGGCDSMIELVNHNEIITVSSSKLKDGKPFDTLHFRMEERGDSVVLVHTDAKASGQKNLTKSERQILDMLELDIFRTAGANTKRIRENTGMAPSTTDRVLSALKNKGYITQSKKGEPYFISEAGIQALSD
jgi:uncharacterized protein YjhX (UPF0386 family)